MQVDIQIDPEFNGPTLLELEPVLFDIEGVVMIPWSNSRKELATLERFRESELAFTLVVRDYDTHMKTAVAVGLYTVVDEDTLRATRESITKKSATNWRQLVDTMGPVKTNTVLASITGSAIRSGKKPKALVSVLSCCLHQGVHPQDVDVLLRSKKLRGM